jgi:hypothetical protein
MANEEPENEIEHKTRASEIASIFRAMAGANNVLIDDAWANLLSTSKSSEEFYSTIAAISKSVDSLVLEIQLSSLRQASKDMYVGAANTFKNYLLVQNMRSLTTDHVRAEVDSFRMLTLLDDVLTPIAVRDIPPQTLHEWQSSLVALMNDAKSAISDETLRAFIVQQLSSLQWAVNNYQWIGIEGVSKTYGAMTAEIARSQGMRGGQNAETQKWYQRAKKPILKIGAAIVAASVVFEASDKLLTSGVHIFDLLTKSKTEEVENFIVEQEEVDFEEISESEETSNSET